MRVKCRQPPKPYGIEKTGNGMATITVTDIVAFSDGEYTVDIFELKGVRCFDGMEENIRKNNRAWVAAGAAVEYEIGVLRAAVMRAADEIRTGGITDERG